MEIQYLKGIGPQRAKLFKRIGIKTVEDLLTYYPRCHEDRRNVKLIGQLGQEEKATIRAQVLSHFVSGFRRRLAVKVVVSDGTGNCWLMYFNQPWITKTLPVGTPVVVYGKFKRISEELVQAKDFTCEILKEGQALLETNRIVPVYPLTERLSQHQIRSLTKQAIEDYVPKLLDYLPETLKKKYNFPDYQDAITSIHFPRDSHALETARKRLVFEECFFFQMALAMKRIEIKKHRKKRRYKLKKHLLTPFRENLPFDFTSRADGRPAQKTVINELFEDLQSPYPMNRLLQGDVGAGKTAVAISCALLVIENKYQVAFMAPTEVLAEQHYISLQKFLQPLIDKKLLRIELLTGSVPAKEKKHIQREIAQIDLLVGTHALIQKKVNFPRLGLVVIDEQHRFGVIQRATLRGKSQNPDVLVMSATPIPRSLALTIYGDLDVSLLEISPPGRKEIITRKLSERQAYSLVKEEVKNHTQAYIVYPLIEESEKLKLTPATIMAEKLQAEVFPEYRVGLLHGKLKAQEKQAVAEKFRAHQIDILVTTTVIEVGMDIPNASVMVICDCQHFGLATLHQLRGRVGRGAEQSYCILVGNPRSKEARKRVQTILETSDGFKLAEEDLKLRGPGELFGVRQHGLPEFKLVDLIKDERVIETARKEATWWAEKPTLLSPQLLQGLAGFSQHKAELIKVG